MLDIISNEVLLFIIQFQTKCVYKEVYDVFASGYCWHFAHMLKDTFIEGDVCLAAPFGHFVYKSIEGRYYDIYGEYDGEAVYFIPESYLSKDMLEDFKHVPNTKYKAPTKEDCIRVMKSYCADNNIKYTSSCEKFLH